MSKELSRRRNREVTESQAPSTCPLKTYLPPILLPFLRKTVGQRMSPLGDIFLPEENVKTRRVYFPLLINLVFHFARIFNKESVFP